MESVCSQNAPAAIGPFSQAVKHNGQIFTSGQIGMNLDGSMPADVAAQTKLALDNLSAILNTAGSALEKVIKTTVFIKNMADYAEINAIYAERFGENKPARSCIEVARLPKDALIEIECIALCD